jgi:SAM-dependent methyltransferase
MGNRQLDFGADTSHWQRRAGECPDGTVRRLAVFEVLAPRAQSQVLDIGCGGGQLMRDLALAVAPNGRAVGIDVSDDQLEAARKFCADAPCAEFFNADVCELAWEDGTFDAASSIQTLEYVADIDRALKEIRRVVRQGSRVAFVSVLWDAYQYYGAEAELNGRVLDAFRAHCPHQMLPLELPRRMVTAGLDGVSQRPLTIYNGSLHENAYAYYASRFVAAFVTTQGIKEDEAQGWLDQLSRADQEGRFGFVSVPVLTIGTAV